jgi:hypothetical protein
VDPSLPKQARGREALLLLKRYTVDHPRGLLRVRTDTHLPRALRKAYTNLPTETARAQRAPKAKVAQRNLRGAKAPRAAKARVAPKARE